MEVALSGQHSALSRRGQFKLDRKAAKEDENLFLSSFVSFTFLPSHPALQRSLRFPGRGDDARALELGAIHLCSEKFLLRKVQKSLYEGSPRCSVRRQQDRHLRPRLLRMQRPGGPRMPENHQQHGGGEPEHKHN